MTVIKVISGVAILMHVIRAECMTAKRFLFEPPPSSGSIIKMQIDLSREKGRWFADVRSARKSGRTLSGRLGCAQISDHVYVCRRFDGGGQFELVTHPNPNLRLRFFTADEEGDEVQTFLRGLGGQELVVEGKKMPASSKHSFP